MDAWTKDLQGGLFDGGLIGAITKPNSKFGKLLKTLDPNLENAILTQLTKNDAILAQVKAASQ